MRNICQCDLQNKPNKKHTHTDNVDRNPNPFIHCGQQQKSINFEYTQPFLINITQ